MKMTDTTRLWIQVVLTGTILFNSTLTLPASRNRHHGVNHFPYDQDFEDDIIKQSVQDFLFNEENGRTRDILRLAVDLYKADDRDEISFPDMPLYDDHIWTVLNGLVTKKNRRRGDVIHRRHTKRAVFDSIAHNGEFGGFGKHREQKLEFTFENLLPYLINEMKRNRRQLPKQFLVR